MVHEGNLYTLFGIMKLLFTFFPVWDAQVLLGQKPLSRSKPILTNPLNQSVGCHLTCFEKILCFNHLLNGQKKLIIKHLFQSCFHNRQLKPSDQPPPLPLWNTTCKGWGFGLGALSPKLNWHQRCPLLGMLYRNLIAGYGSQVTSSRNMDRIQLT